LTLFLPRDAMRCAILLSYRNSVRPSVCHTRGPHGSTYDHDFFAIPYDRPMILVFGDITFIPKFKGGHPERGRWIGVWKVRIGDLIGDFLHLSHRISETVQYRPTTKVTTEYEYALSIGTKINDLGWPWTDLGWQLYIHSVALHTIHTFFGANH